MNGLRKIFTAGIAALLLAGCDRDNVKVYHVAQGQDETQPQIAPAELQTNSSAQMLPPGHPDISGMNATTPAENQNTNPANSIWTIPPDWKQLPSSEFLLAHFSVSDANGASAEINVAELGGNGGGLLPNINRWRGQLGLGAAGENDLPQMTQSLDVSGGKATLVDFSGINSETGAQTRLIAVVVPQAGATWFYKLMGDEKMVAQQKDAFLKFIQSAKYSNAR